VIHRGQVAAQWGEPGRADIAFSVTKSALSTLAGLALAEGRIPALDGTVRESVDAAEFASAPNDAITWRHLLTLTSEWRGSLWGIPDSIDWNRAVPKRPDSPPKGTQRQTFPPGGFWEFNDVRVNVLALGLTHVFGESLEDVLRRRIMNPIGASPDWRWHGYIGSEITLGGRRIPAVSGGAHWGGGLVISSFDLARLALLYARRGRWGDTVVLPTLWFDAIRAPTALNPNFGLMWWVNSGGTIPALSRSAIWGSGIANFLVVDPERDLVIVLRWYDVPRRDELLARIVGALEP
jgi:CubicO group peptidase (beta-lactamase class C family)